MQRRCVRFSATLSLLFFLVLLIVPVASEAIDTGFSVRQMEQERVSDIWESIGLEMIEEPENRSGFSCFDVNENNSYALGFRLGSENAVLVYNEQNEYLCGFSFESSGDFGIELRDGIVLYLVRSNAAILIDENGDCVDMKEICETSENNDYWNNSVYAGRKTVNGVVYCAENGPINIEFIRWGTYSRLVKVLPDGERVVLHDGSARMLVVTIMISAVVLVFLLFVGAVFYRRLRRRGT